jgi:hypothetical protein
MLILIINKNKILIINKNKRRIIMRVKDILCRLGYNMFCDIQVHWDYELDPENDHRMKSDSIDTILEFFGDWVLDEKDSIYFSMKDKNDCGTLDLYLKKPTVN